MNRTSFFAAPLLLAFAVAAGCSSSNPNNVSDHGKTVSSVEVAPNKTAVSKGVTLQLNATVQYADGTSKDVTTDPSTVWNTSDTNIATVSTTGRVTTTGEGVVDITADYMGETGDEHFAVTP